MCGRVESRLICASFFSNFEVGRTPARSSGVAAARMCAGAEVLKLLCGSFRVLCGKLGRPSFSGCLFGEVYVKRARLWVRFGCVLF